MVTASGGHSTAVMQQCWDVFDDGDGEKTRVIDR
jgi:hypothetical protein